MMSRTYKRTTKFLIPTLCIALLIITSLILAPAVGALRGADKTETEINNLNKTTDSVEEQLTLNRAITIDAAKKEALEAVEKQLSILAEEQKADDTEAPTEAAAAETTATFESYEETEADDKTESYSSSSDSYYSGSSYVTSTPGFGGYLMSIDNPDPSYAPYAISLSDYDRDKVERVVMREMGYCGYNGMALVAQCMRDAFIRSGFTSADSVINTYGYQGPLSLTPSAECKEVVRYIFDQGGSAVQHRLICYYASNYCTSSWHESQNFVVQYEYSRFFDSVY